MHQHACEGSSGQVGAATPGQSGGPDQQQCRRVNKCEVRLTKMPIPHGKVQVDRSMYLRMLKSTLSIWGVTLWGVT